MINVIRIGLDNIYISTLRNFIWQFVSRVLNTHAIWIEKGYEHFENYGPDIISIKLIAKESSIYPVPAAE